MGRQIWHQDRCIPEDKAEVRGVLHAAIASEKPEALDELSAYEAPAPEAQACFTEGMLMPQVKVRTEKNK